MKKNVKKIEHIEKDMNKNMINNISKNKSSISNIKKKKIKINNIIIFENESKTNINEKVEKIMEYNDDEINTLSYDLALQNDRRTYCQYYASLLKTRHIIIFSFCHNNNYNAKAIQIDLFFIGFTIYYTVNALFYNDSTMHNIYVKKGSFDIEYKIPKIVYSSLISMLLNVMLKLLALSNDIIIEFKQKKESADIIRKGNELIKKLNIRFILYFIISFIFLLFFWYYISMFCAIYRNTQYQLLEDTLISFVLSFFYPFGIYLFPGLFRISALSKPNEKKEYLYKFSKILQML